MLAAPVPAARQRTHLARSTLFGDPTRVFRLSLELDRHGTAFIFSVLQKGSVDYSPPNGFPFYSTPESQQAANETPETAGTGTSANNEPPPDFSWLRLHDPASFLMLKTPELPMHPRPYEQSRQAVDPFKIGTGSHREDVISAFLACVKMRKLDRAELMLDRLHHDFIACTSIEQDQKSLDQEMVMNHNCFLRGYLAQAKDAAEKKEEYEKKKEALSTTTKGAQSVDINEAVSSSTEEVESTSTERGQESVPTESKAEVRAMLKECEAALDYNVEKIEGWFRRNMTEKYKLKGNDDTYAVLLEAAILSSRTVRPKKQEIAKIIFEWQQQKAGILGDVLRHLPASAIEVVKTAHKIVSRDLHPEQEYILADYQKPEIAEVMATDIKGTSLAAVKQSLQSFADHSVEKYMPVFKNQEEKDQYMIDRQKVLEQDAYEAAINRWRADAEDPSSSVCRSHNPNLNPLLHQWLVNMIPLIKQELKHVEEAEADPQDTNNFERCQYGPYLRLLSPEKLAGITITNIIRLATGWHDSTAMKASAAVISVGRAVEHEYISEQLKKQFETKQGDERFYQKKSLQKQLAEARNEKDISMLVYRQNRRAEMEQDGSELILEQRWSQPMKAKVGSILVSLLFQCAKIQAKPTNPKVLHTVSEDLTLEQPALYHGYQFVGGKKIGVIKLHDEFSSKLMMEPLKGTTLTKLLPMVARPRPWCAWNDGAYYFTPCRMVRIKDCLEQTLYIKEASKQGNLDRVFAGLDVLGSTAWQINQKVFDVILKVWNTGEAFAAIPPSSSKDMPFPEEPPADADVATKAAFKVAHQELALLRKNHHSQRCDVNFKMEIARAFYNEEFYFPHNVDFRGRAYAMPPHLNHIGNDLCRGLLKFSEKKPLGESGLRWLKIHLANLCGFDKASLKAREEWTEANLEKVFDSARKPLEVTRWWLQSEDPWQTLATCFELEEALTSPDPLAFESNMPVHQDGTCNGLQHYAALGGDVAGAKQVNLEPAEKPQDVYTGVADLVNEAVAKDAKNGHPEAKELLGHINRKVVKQTVMTNVYGVTFIGAKAQVKNRLVEKGVFPKDRTDKLALYLTRKIFDSLQTMFTGAHLIQKWFGECAKRISRSVSPQQYQTLNQHLDGSIPVDGRQAHTKERGKVEFMTSVVWTTPLGLPVVQPYRHEATVAVKTNLQQITIVDTSIINQVNSRRQMAAFPPNFVHSLDATHMLLSALASKRAGLTFAAVHDSFWTHACHVDTMSRVLRDAFVNLHSEDIVQKLRDEFVLRYKGYKTLVVIPEAHPAGKAITQHRREISPIIEARKAEAEAIRAAKVAKEEAEAAESGEVKPKRRGPGMKKASKAPPKKISMTVVDDLLMELERDQLLASSNPAERNKGKNMVTAASIYQSYGLTPEHDFDKVESAGFGEEMSSGAGDINLLELDLQTGGSKKAIKNSKTPKELEAAADEKEAKEETETKKKAPTKGVWTRVYVWVDLEFPEVPKKGDFDVARLKDSNCAKLGNRNDLSSARSENFEILRQASHAKANPTVRVPRHPSVTYGSHTFKMAESKRKAPKEGRSQAKRNMPIITDPRFSHVHWDPKFDMPKKRDRPVLDSRFNALLEDPEFEIVAKKDRYGRRLPPNKHKEEMLRSYTFEDYPDGVGKKGAKEKKADKKVDKPLRVKEQAKKELKVAEPSSSEAEDDPEDPPKDTPAEELEDELEDAPEDKSQEEEDESEDEDEDESSDEAVAASGYDPARGQGVLSDDTDSDSDSDSESVIESEAEDAEAAAQEAEAIPLGDITPRLAAVNLDWDYMKSTDLYVAFSSFVPVGGRILSVAIYPSEFGKERMEREEMEGPPKEVFGLSSKVTKKGKKERKHKPSSHDDGDDEMEITAQTLVKEDTGEEVNSTALRRYQLERLRYFYAIVTCDSAATANAIYTQCDGAEYGTTANFFDLRFVPDDTEFDDTPRDECSEPPKRYRPVEFSTDALQHSKVKLTWDQEDTGRKEAVKEAFSRRDVEQMDLQAYLASDSDEDEEDARDAYRKMLGLPPAAEKAANAAKGEKKPVGNMEVTFSAALTEEDGKKRDVFERDETAIERYVRKEKERKKARKEKRKEKLTAQNGEDDNAQDEEHPDAELAEDLGFDDPFFENPEKSNTDSKKERKQKKREEKERIAVEQASKREELEAIMAADNEDSSLQHFNMNDIRKREKLAKLKGKAAKRMAKERGLQEAEGLQQDYKMDVSDPRFSAIYEKPEFAIDPTNPRYKKTQAMEKVMEERRKRRAGDEAGSGKKKRRT
ncbi:hypothetical protein Dda_2808 [Drechslerella dactyloides]|uniref:DNA-directed RNA polymerase n=1 Tax=Drechslerella dactyloides TaxID=74499 RepID=A0AAD6J154_DREDA|nr:hypothetical protein Dda_2808 [Drechslerella dactyloides]